MLDSVFLKNYADKIPSKRFCVSVLSEACNINLLPFSRNSRALVSKSRLALMSGIRSPVFIRSPAYIPDKFPIGLASKLLAKDG